MPVGLALLLAVAGVRLAVLLGAVRVLVGAAVDLPLLRRARTLRAGALLRVAALLGRTVLALRAGALLLRRAAVDLALGAVRAILRAGLRRHRAGTPATLRVRVPVALALLRRALAVGGWERSGRRALAGLGLAVLLGAVGVRLAGAVLAGLLRAALLRRLRAGGLLRGGVGESAGGRCPGTRDHGDVGVPPRPACRGAVRRCARRSRPTSPGSESLMAQMHREPVRHEGMVAPGPKKNAVASGGYGVGFVTATADRLTIRNFTETAGLFRTLGASGFRRFSTYRQATAAATATNTVFGFLRTYVMLAVAGSAAALGGQAAGYDAPQLITYVWVGQGLIGVVGMWGWTELADRIRSGDVVTDLLRPVHPVLGYLLPDLGRAAYALLTRFVVPIVVGALAFDMYLPRRPATYPLFAVSVLLAVLVCFAGRFLANAAGYWLLDTRGVLMGWALCAGVLGGLYFPIRFLPEWAATALYLGTPFPSLLQVPLDVLVERDPPIGQLGLLGLQALWAGVLFTACVVVQRRAERRLVVQGG
ncbi:ABC transporter permease [Catellatospora coxensis]